MSKRSTWDKSPDGRKQFKFGAGRQHQQQQQQQQQRETMKGVLARVASSSSAPLGPATPLSVENAPVDSPMFEQQLRQAQEWTVEVTARIKRLLKQLRTVQSLEADLAAARKQALVTMQDLLGEIVGGETRDLAGAVELLRMLTELDAERAGCAQKIAADAEHKLDGCVHGEVKEALDAYKTYQKSNAQCAAAAARVSRLQKESARVAELEHEAEDARKAHERNAAQAATSLKAATAKLPLALVDTALDVVETEAELVARAARTLAGAATKLSGARASAGALRRKADSMTPCAVVPSLSSVVAAAHDGAASGTPRAKKYAIEGYLFKQAANLTKGWHRRYFVIRDGKIFYYKHGYDFHQSSSSSSSSSSGGSDAGESSSGSGGATTAARSSGSSGSSSDPPAPAPAPETVMDIILTTVRPKHDTGRRFCFELISPDRTFLLQAESQAVYNEWMSVIENVREQCLEANTTSSTGCFGSSSSSSSSGSSSRAFGKSASASALAAAQSSTASSKKDTTEMMGVLWSLDKANCVCCDCGAPNPDWVSINLGLLCCINCSGIHRSLGVAYSKVRSFKLDSLDEDVLVLIARLGNRCVNAIFEASVPGGRAKPCADARDDARAAWIRDKYVRRAFLAPPARGAAPAEQQLRAACEHDSLEQMLLWIARGADVSRAHEPGGETCLHIALRQHQAPACQLLLLNGADPAARTRTGATPLHYAAMYGVPELVSTLLRAGADPLAADNAGRTPLMVAVPAARKAVELAQCQCRAADPAERARCQEALRAADRELKERAYGARLADALRSEYTRARRPGYTTMAAPAQRRAAPGSSYHTAAAAGGGGGPATPARAAAASRYGTARFGTPTAAGVRKPYGATSSVAYGSGASPSGTGVPAPPPPAAQAPAARHQASASTSGTVLVKRPTWPAPPPPDKKH